MRHILLGNTGVSVSVIGLGTWSYGGSNLSRNSSVGWSGHDDARARAALVAAWKQGINHWDTADVYGDGRSEQLIGSVWKTVPRQDIFLATKVGWDQGTYDHYYHPQFMRARLERSLRNLRCEVIDLYYLHHCRFGSREEYFDGALETIRRFREEGKIRLIGLSDWQLTRIMRFVDRAVPDVVQPYRNVLDDTYESSGLKAWIDARQAGVMFFSPLRHGLLTGKYSRPVEFPAGDFRSSVAEFKDPDLIRKMQTNRARLEQRFREHPQPVLHGLVDSLLADAPTGGALLGQRNPNQVAAAASLGTPLSRAAADWVFSLYRRG